MFNITKFKECCGYCVFNSSIVVVLLHSASSYTFTFYTAVLD